MLTFRTTTGGGGGGENVLNSATFMDDLDSSCNEPDQNFPKTRLVCINYLIHLKLNNYNALHPTHLHNSKLNRKKLLYKH